MRKPGGHFSAQFTLMKISVVNSRFSFKPGLKCIGLKSRTFSSSNERLSNINELPAAADILYRNPEAIQNRLNLFHHFRLRAQAEIDREELVGIVFDIFLTNKCEYKKCENLLKLMNPEKLSE